MTICLCELARHSMEISQRPPVGSCTMNLEELLAGCMSSASCFVRSNSRKPYVRMGLGRSGLWESPAGEAGGDGIAKSKVEVAVRRQARLHTTDFPNIVVLSTVKSIMKDDAVIRRRKTLCRCKASTRVEPVHVCVCGRISA